MKKKISYLCQFLVSQSVRGIKYLENKGSAQCKSSVMFAAINASGTTSIKAKKSRNHSELLFKYLKNTHQD